jgi:hypothetical protein
MIPAIPFQRGFLYTVLTRPGLSWPCNAFEIRAADRRRHMKNTLASKKTPRPMGSLEFGTLMLLALLVAPLAIHVLASLAA